MNDIHPNSMGSQTTPPSANLPHVPPEALRLGKMHPVFIDRTRQIYCTWKIPPSIVIPVHHLKVLHEVDLAITRLQHMNNGFASMAKYDHTKTGIALTPELIELAKGRVRWGLGISISLGNILISLYQFTTLHCCDMSKDLDIIIGFLIPLAEHLKPVWQSYRRIFPPLGRGFRGPRQILEPEVEGFTNVVEMAEAWVKEQVTLTDKWWPDIYERGLQQAQQLQQGPQGPTGTAPGPAQTPQPNTGELEEPPHVTQVSDQTISWPDEAVTQASEYSQSPPRVAAGPADSILDAPGISQRPTQPHQRRPKSPKTRGKRSQRRPDNPKIPLQRSRRRSRTSQEIGQHLQGPSQSSQGGLQPSQRPSQAIRQLPQNFQGPLVPSRKFNTPPQQSPQGFRQLPPDFEGPLVPTRWLDMPPPLSPMVDKQLPSSFQGPLVPSRRVDRPPQIPPQAPRQLPPSPQEPLEPSGRHAQSPQPLPQAPRQLRPNIQGPLEPTQRTNEPAQGATPVLPKKLLEQSSRPPLGNPPNGIDCKVNTTTGTLVETAVETPDGFSWGSKWFLPIPPTRDRDLN